MYRIGIVYRKIRKSPNSGVRLISVAVEGIIRVGANHKC